MKVRNWYGNIYYYNDLDEIHRDDDLPAIETKDGGKYWVVNGRYYRVGNPAVELSSGTKYWYFNNLLHRNDGPAIEYVNGEKQYWLFNVQYTEKEYLQQIKLKGFW